MSRIPDRYIMNLGILTNEEFNKIQSKRVAIVGLGGLGGNLCNLLVRLGVKKLLLIDFDFFCESNLNRQLFSNEKNIELHKADVIKTELLKIKSDLEIDIFVDRVQNCDIKNVDYVIDCVDDIETKLYLCDICNDKNIYLLHGSCAGWYGQLGWISPGNRLLHNTYGNRSKGLEESLFNPSFTPSVVASYMVSEYVKMHVETEEVVLDQLLLIDLFHNETRMTSRRN